MWNKHKQHSKLELNVNKFGQFNCISFRLISLDQPTSVIETPSDKALQSNQSESETLVKLDAKIRSSDSLDTSASFIITEASADGDLVKLDVKTDSNQTVVNETNTEKASSECNQAETADVESALDEMTASFSKPRITTEEEAKAALAERRRFAREEAERRAEQERLEKEEAQRLERERQQREEEQQSLLIQQMKEAEEKRLLEV